MKKLTYGVFSLIILISLFLFVAPSEASAHCDTLDGPVVAAARKALNTNNANYVLIWVKPENENEIRKALKRAGNKRKGAKTKKEKNEADMEFFEALVRIHREGEGAKYEGIKPAGSIEPEIKLADEAVETGKLDDVIHHIQSPENREIITHLFHKIQKKANYDLNDVLSGREFIEAYVIFIHAVEKAIKGEVLQENHLHEHAG